MIRKFITSILTHFLCLTVFLYMIITLILLSPLLIITLLLEKFGYEDAGHLISKEYDSLFNKDMGYLERKNK